MSLCPNLLEITLNNSSKQLHCVDNEHIPTVQKKTQPVGGYL